MPRGWTWDESLYRGSAPYYERGRLPYPAGLADSVRDALALDGRGRLLDVGCGPGIVALRLAHLFERVVGLDADSAMLAEAARRAAMQGVENARWLRALAEHLPVAPRTFRAATFAQSFHWTERERVAATIFDLLEPGGAFVQVSAAGADTAPETDDALAVAADATSTSAAVRVAGASSPPHPSPPQAEIDGLVRRYLGPVRRAGQGVLAYGTPGGEDTVLRQVGFGEMQVTRIPGGEVIVRSVDDLVAAVFSNSASAPHLFGERLPAFESELRALLTVSSDDGHFLELTGDTEVRVWRTPHAHLA